jgi:hypothetical protein
MSRLLAAVALLALPLTASASKLSKLSEQEQIEYRVFRAFMTEDDQKAWLRLKTPEERTAWLKDHHLWEKFYTESTEVQALIVSGKVALGWTRDQVYLAWGNPFQKQRLTGREAQRSELLVYRFEVDKDGYATPLVGKKEDYKAVDRYQVELVMDDDVVAELSKKEEWE